VGLDIVRAADGEAQLYLWLGSFALSREVQREMDGPLTSGPGVQWFVALDEGAVVGFCSLRAERAVYWFDYVYVVPERRGQGVHTRLAQAREDYLATLPPHSVNVCCRTRRWPHYARRGFNIKRRRGDWIYGVRHEPAGE